MGQNTASPDSRGHRRAADVLAERLYAAGCRRAYGMPGGEVLTLVDALRKAGIAFTLVKHENAGGFIAEGGHHVDGAPALLVATLGPGVLNAVNVIANAQQDRVPLIFLTGCVDADEAQTYTHQVLDHQAVLGPVTKASFRLTPGAADVIADKAVAIATEPRPGPVHIDVPISVAEAPCPAGHARPMRVAAAATAPAGAELAAAQAAIEGAERPIILAGLDILGDDSAEELRAFAERFAMPVITTYKAKGVFPEDHPLSLGAAGLSPLADRHLLPLVAEADLVLLLGYDPIEMRTGWRNAFDTDRQTVIDIAAVPNTHYMHQGSLNFIAETGATLAALAAGAGARPTWTDGQLARTRAALAAAFPADDDWGPAGVISEARACLPEDTLVSVDSGAHRILLNQMWTCRAPRELVQSSALCTMGCALPLAIGLKHAAPDRPVVGIMGDAGFYMTAGELATAAELGLAPIFIVFSDASLALIELKQRQRQLQNTGVDFARGDLAAIARGFGGEGHSVRNRVELRAAIEAGLASDRFTLISAEIAPGGYDGRI